jgi:hypothetical protein
MCGRKWQSIPLWGGARAVREAVKKLKIDYLRP